MEQAANLSELNKSNFFLNIDTNYDELFSCSYQGCAEGQSKRKVHTTGFALFQNSSNAPGVLDLCTFCVFGCWLSRPIVVKSLRRDITTFIVLVLKDSARDHFEPG